MTQEKTVVDNVVGIFVPLSNNYFSENITGFVVVVTELLEIDIFLYELLHVYVLFRF